ncbi:hypothetical protein [Pseudomonas hamedanensis]|uniref:Uncharacterized protein n=1 Tax=Pseudomonas hamedanensis TaxID=2745504 RepID=A0A9E6TEI3_9PSED|nr:hypothetical protein [Pseudomonas hamedanensis]QXI14978.1 hypothetical protein HU739_013640 [Pseudomonas hamedanensis]
MISYIHAPVLAACFFTLLFMRRWWLYIDRMGFSREVGRRAPSLVQGDILAATLAIVPFLVAAVDWFGITLPRQSAPIAPGMAALISVVCLSGCVFVLRNSGQRFAGHWAGTRESALRTVVALRIIDASELAHALDVLQQHEARQFNDRTIDAEAREVRK